MAETEQMFGNDRGGLLFVGLDGVGHGGVMVNHGDGDTAFDEFREVVIVLDAESRPHDEAIDAAIQEAIDLAEAVAFFVFEVGHVAEAADPDRDRQVVVLGKRVVDAREDADPERIVRRDHDADRLGATGLHAVDEQIAAPAELAGRLEDATAGIFTEAFAIAAENARSGSERNVRGFGDIFQAGDMRGSHRLLVNIRFNRQVRRGRQED